VSTCTKIINDDSDGLADRLARFQAAKTAALAAELVDGLKQAHSHPRSAPCLFCLWLLPLFEPDQHKPVGTSACRDRTSLALPCSEEGIPMEISVHSLTFLLGCVLIVVAIIGGGFEITQIRIPKVGFIARIMAAIFGSILLLVSMGNPEFFSSMNGNSSRDRSPATTQPMQQSAQENQYRSVITIYNYLNDPQIYENVSVTMSGSQVGNLLVDRNRRVASIVVRLEGRVHYYSLGGTSTIQTRAGASTRIVIGSGTMDFSVGQEYFVVIADQNEMVVNAVLMPGRS
jgi:hypothetical protein